MFQSEFYAHREEIIKIFGIGGAGCNAVNYMHQMGIQGVQFYICNTDAQCLEQSTLTNKIHIGPELTQGLGAGSNPEVGRQATLESESYIRSILEKNTKMVFVTAGMGGGTGTGGAPVIAKIAKELGILTIGIVTTPFHFEGKKRTKQAEEGIKNLRAYVDTLLIISNEKLKSMHQDLSMTNAFNKADDILLNSTKCVTDVINTPGKINVDFADVCTVMKNGGVALFGTSERSGHDRANLAIQDAIQSPLLSNNDISSAKWILLNISSPKGEYEITMQEIDIIQNILIQHVGEESNIILGTSYNNTFENQIGITLIATGFQKDPQLPEKMIEQNAHITHTVEKRKTTIDHFTAQPVTQTEEPTVRRYEQTELFSLNGGTTNTPNYTEEEKVEVIEFSNTLPTNNFANTNHSSGFSLQKPKSIYAEYETLNTNPTDAIKSTISTSTTDDVTENYGATEGSEVCNEDSLFSVSYIEDAIHTEDTHYQESVLSNFLYQQEEPKVTPSLREKILEFQTNPTSLHKQSQSIQETMLRNETMKKLVETLHQPKPTIKNINESSSNYAVESDTKSHSKINALHNFLFGHKPD